jgi:hypothetical protein
LDEKRELLRHTIATLAYRSSKVVRGAPDGFGSFRPGPSSRTPGEILAHLVDLIAWAFQMANGRQVWKATNALTWAEDTERFFEALHDLDDFLATDQPLGATAERLFQGPVADALTHVGQIAMLRRMADAPIKGENYFVAEITAGSVGLEQATPKREFD